MHRQLLKQQPDEKQRKLLEAELVRSWRACSRARCPSRAGDVAFGLCLPTSVSRAPFRSTHAPPPKHPQKKHDADKKAAQRLHKAKVAEEEKYKLNKLDPLGEAMDSTRQALQVRARVFPPRVVVSLIWVVY